MTIESIRKQIAGAADVPAELVSIARDDVNAQLTVTCFALAKQRGKSPAEIADEIAEKLSDQEFVQSASAAGPYVNIALKDSIVRQLSKATHQPTAQTSKHALFDYGDPNPFKAMHVGHLYTTVVGEALARIKEAQGIKVSRLNYGGDVGLHVARAMWGIADTLGYDGYDDPAIVQALEDLSLEESLEPLTRGDLAPSASLSGPRAKWVSSCYVRGTAADIEDSEANKQIRAYNKAVYQIHYDNDHESPFAKVYWTCRQWCYDAFDLFFESIGVQYDRVIPESTIFEKGLNTVSAHMGEVYEEDAGAIIFRGEDHDLHNRVFINSEGNPTYEAKDLGLAEFKAELYPDATESIIITSKEQTEYFKVVYKSIEQFDPKTAAITKHIPHSYVKLAGGKKMSSRKGDVLFADDVIAAARAGFEGEVDEVMVQASYKFGLLKTNPRDDINYDVSENASVKGKSGPYLLYAYARANSVLEKVSTAETSEDIEYTDDERNLVWRIAKLPLAIERAADNYDPSEICTYVYELAKAFSVFYENNRVAGDEREAIRAEILRSYMAVLKTGLDLLGIKTLTRV